MISLLENCMCSVNQMQFIMSLHSLWALQTYSFQFGENKGKYTCKPMRGDREKLDANSEQQLWTKHE